MRCLVSVVCRWWWFDARQGQVPTAHEALTTRDQVADLSPQFTVSVPAPLHGLQPKQGLGQTPVRSTRQRCIQRLQGAQVYFHPAGRVRGEMNAIWSDLTGGAPGETLSLPVNGRTVEVPRFANGIAAIAAIPSASETRARRRTCRPRRKT